MSFLIFSSKLLPCDMPLSISGTSLHLDIVLNRRGNTLKSWRCHLTLKASRFCQEWMETQSSELQKKEKWWYFEVLLSLSIHCNGEEIITLRLHVPPQSLHGAHSCLSKRGKALLGHGLVSAVASMAKKPWDQVSNLRKMAAASTAALGLLKSQEQTTTINARLALAWVIGNLRCSIAVAWDTCWSLGLSLLPDNLLSWIWALDHDSWGKIGLHLASVYWWDCG